MDGNGYLDTRQAAEHLNMRPKTLARYRVTGEGPVYHLVGRLVRYLREDLDRWMKGRRRASTSDDGSALPAPDTPGAEPGSGDPGVTP